MTAIFRAVAVTAIAFPTPAARRRKKAPSAVLDRPTPMAAIRSRAVAGGTASARTVRRIRGNVSPHEDVGRLSRDRRRKRICARGDARALLITMAYSDECASTRRRHTISKPSAVRTLASGRSGSPEELNVRRQALGRRTGCSPAGEGGAEAKTTRRSAARSRACWRKSR
jgi:hypothetical protein